VKTAVCGGMEAAIETLVAENPSQVRSPERQGRPGDRRVPCLGSSEGKPMPGGELVHRAHGLADCLGSFAEAAAYSLRWSRRHRGLGDRSNSLGVPRGIAGSPLSKVGEQAATDFIPHIGLNKALVRGSQAFVELAGPVVAYAVQKVAAERVDSDLHDGYQMSPRSWRERRSGRALSALARRETR
jgi:hypothetical protein